MRDADIERYKRWVRTLPCGHCGARDQVEAAHYSGFSGHLFGRGMGKKSKDLMLAPLCGQMSARRCHPLFDSGLSASDSFDHLLSKDHSAFRLATQIDHSERFLAMIHTTLLRAINEGVLDIKVVFK